MKIAFYKITFFAFLLLLNSKAIGQQLFSLEPDYHYVIPNLPDTIFDYDSYSSWSDFETISEETIYLKWQVVKPDDCPDEWQFQVGDTQLHWTSFITTNIDSANNFIHPMPLNPDWPNNTFELAVLPQQVKGCCKVQVLFSLVDDPDNIIEVVTYDIAMLDSSCFISAQNIVVQEEKVLVSPIPANSSFQVSTSSPIVAACLYNVMGNIATKANWEGKGSFEVAGLPNGTYFLQLRQQNGQVVWVKVVVQH